jgi:hypothetical protein
MTWHRPDGSRYLERDYPSKGIERVMVLGTPPRAPETPVAPSEADESPVHPPQTARERLSAVLDRIRAGELAAVGELPAALANARKEARQ